MNEERNKGCGMWRLLHMLCFCEWIRFIAEAWILEKNINPSQLLLHDQWESRIYGHKALLLTILRRAYLNSLP